MKPTEQKHNFQDGGCINCGIIEKYAEDEPCEEEDTEWIFEQMQGLRDTE